MAAYAHPEVLVETDWVKENMGQPGIKLVEIDVDTNAYDAGHIPGAIGLNWTTQLNDRVLRDVINKKDFEKLMSQSGINNDDAIVVYGDNHNWFAAFGFWIMKMYGHEDVRIMNGGRQKWLDEDDKPMTIEEPQISPTTYKVTAENKELRALVPDVMKASRDKVANLVDVRSPDEFTGKVIAPPGMSETAQRGGHVPGAVNVPWSTAVSENGTFRSADELEKIYRVDAGIDFSRPTIAYCRIGERSSHTWFVLKYLLGIQNVTNYDGSWTEYGNLIGAPIERSAG